LLSSRGIDTQSLQARGEQRRSIYFNNDRDIPCSDIRNRLDFGMISVSDILKLLDQIPIWKAVSSLPRRVSELEKKVAELEGKTGNIGTKSPSGRECPICGASMKVINELPHPQFAFAGRKVHDMECLECGHKTRRDFEPGKGYR
jgi:Zn ribbon nucleic-acid-binding protein